MDGASCGAWDGSLPRLGDGKLRRRMEGEYVVRGVFEHIFEWEGSNEIIIMSVCEDRCYLVCFL